MYVVITAAAGSIGVLSFFLYKFFFQRQSQQHNRALVDKSGELADLNTNNNNNFNNTSLASETGKNKSNGKIQHGIAELMGRRQTMEDTHCIVANIGGSPYSFFGVYDGHGGDKAARFLRDNLHMYVEAMISEESSPEEALSKAIMKAEEEFMQVARETEIQDGSTIVCALVGQGVICMANVGDSEAILSRNQQHLVLTTVHTPGRNKEEAKRVEQAGGRLMRGRVGHPHFNPRCFNLAVSRAVGDLMYKSEEFVQDKNSGVVAVADTRVVEMGEGDEFVILACDGVWDVLEYQAARDLTSEWLQQGVSAQEAVEKLVTDAYEKGSRDNITACLIVF